MKLTTNRNHQSLFGFIAVVYVSLFQFARVSLLVNDAEASG